MNAIITSTRAKCPGTSKSELPYADGYGRGQLTHESLRYFSQRYSIFSWYDEGICMTDDAWFGVTPEPVAK